MGRYYVPGPKAEEVDQQDTVIRRVSTSTGLMWGVAERGPCSKAMGPFYNLQQWETVFGGPLTSYNSWFHVRAFFRNGGAELYFVRLAHYTDILDADTRAGVATSRTILSAEGSASAAVQTGSSAPTFSLNAGDTFVCDVDNNGADTATFDAAAASVTDTTTYPVTGGTSTLKLKIDRGEEQTITFDGTETSNDDIAATVNDQLLGGSAVVTGGQVVISSDTEGTGSYVEITELPAGNPALVFSTSEVQGTGDVADIKAVTYAEVKTVLEADLTGGSGVTVSQNSQSYPVITSGTTGASSELDIQSGDAVTKLGFTVSTTTGAAAATDNTLTLKSGYRGYESPGTYANGHIQTKVYKDTAHTTQGAGSDLAADTGASAVQLSLTTLEGLKKDSIIKIWDGSNSEYRQLTKAWSTVESGTVKHYVEFTTALTNSYLSAAAQVESREFTVEVYWDGELVEKWDRMVMLDTHDDYIETIMNDESTGSKYLLAVDEDSSQGLGADIPATDSAITNMTVSGTSEITGLTTTDYIGAATSELGIYAAESVADSIGQVAIPGVTTPAVAVALAEWCESHTWIYATLSVPLTYDYSTAAAWRKNTLGLYSKFACVEYPGVKVYDPTSTGTLPSRVISSEGHVMGLRARVDNIPGEKNGGVWSSAAGSGEFGRLKDVLDLERGVTDSDQTVLNPISVNCLRKFNGEIVRYGARTLSANIKWRYENTTRFFMFAEKSIVEGSRWATFRNNDFRLWRKIEDSVDDFCEGIQDEFAFPGETKDDNWFVNTGIDKGVMDENDRDNGEVITEVGLAPHKPGEFIIFRFSQFRGGSSIEEV
jgi:phage tail sheath protein FI